MKKIAKSEIERAESQKRQEAIRKTQEQQTEVKENVKNKRDANTFLGVLFLNIANF